MIKIILFLSKINIAIFSSIFLYVQFSLIYERFFEYNFKLYSPIESKTIVLLFDFPIIFIILLQEKIESIKILLFINCSLLFFNTLIVYLLFF